MVGIDKREAALRRVAGDTVGLLSLLVGALGIITIFPGSGWALRNWSTVAILMLLALLASYVFWVRLGNETALYGHGVLATVVLGFGFLIIDFLGGRLFHPELGVLEGTTSNSFFWVTLGLPCIYRRVLSWLDSQHRSAADPEM